MTLRGARSIATWAQLKGITLEQSVADNFSEAYGVSYADFDDYTKEVLEHLMEISYDDMTYVIAYVDNL